MNIKIYIHIINIIMPFPFIETKTINRSFTRNEINIFVPPIQIFTAMSNIKIIGNTNKINTFTISIGGHDIFIFKKPFYNFNDIIPIPINNLPFLYLHDYWFCIQSGDLNEIYSIQYDVNQISLDLKACEIYINNTIINVHNFFYIDFEENKLTHSYSFYIPYMIEKINVIVDDPTNIYNITLATTLTSCCKQQILFHTWNNKIWTVDITNTNIHNSDMLMNIDGNNYNNVHIQFVRLNRLILFNGMGSLQWE